jgi:hypothetical protein
MGHISELALFDYISGKADLTTEEREHLLECADCREEVIELERFVQASPDVKKAKQLLAEDGELPLTTEPAEEPFWGGHHL